MSGVNCCAWSPSCLQHTRRWPLPYQMCSLLLFSTKPSFNTAVEGSVTAVISCFSHHFFLVIGVLCDGVTINLLLPIAPYLFPLSLSHYYFLCTVSTRAPVGDSFLPMLSFLVKNGNVTVHQWKYGRAPDVREPSAPYHPLAPLPPPFLSLSLPPSLPLSHPPSLPPSLSPSHSLTVAIDHCCPMTHAQL